MGGSGSLNAYVMQEKALNYFSGRPRFRDPEGKSLVLDGRASTLHLQLWKFTFFATTN